MPLCSHARDDHALLWVGLPLHCCTHGQAAARGLRQRGAAGRASVRRRCGSAARRQPHCRPRRPPVRLVARPDNMAARGGQSRRRAPFRSCVSPGRGPPAPRALALCCRGRACAAGAPRRAPAGREVGACIGRADWWTGLWRGLGVVVPIDRGRSPAGRWRLRGGGKAQENGCVILAPRPASGVRATEATNHEPQPEPPRAAVPPGPAGEPHPAQRRLRERQRRHQHRHGRAGEEGGAAGRARGPEAPGRPRSGRPGAWAPALAAPNPPAIFRTPGGTARAKGCGRHPG